MNTQITIHPKLQHYGLTIANLDAMTDWYRKVLGMTVNHRAAVPPEAGPRAVFGLCISQQRSDGSPPRIV